VSRIVVIWVYCAIRVGIYSAYAGVRAIIYTDVKPCTSGVTERHVRIYRRVIGSVIPLLIYECSVRTDCRVCRNCRVVDKLYADWDRGVFVPRHAVQLRFNNHLVVICPRTRCIRCKHRPDECIIVVNRNVRVGAIGKLQMDGMLSRTTAASSGGNHCSSSCRIRSVCDCKGIWY